MTAGAGTHSGRRPRVVLVGCVSAKQHVVAPARELYMSPLFAKRRAYAEATGDPWAILSALHGLVQPDARIAPYNRELKPPGIAQWSGVVRAGLIAWLGGPELAQVVLEVHAGVHYVDGLERTARWLARFGDGAPTIDAPLRGLPIGRQLAWYGSISRPPDG